MSKATGGSTDTALLDHLPEVTVPDSPAGLWVSTSRPVTATGATTWGHVSADTASWVAPPVTFSST